MAWVDVMAVIAEQSAAADAADLALAAESSTALTGTAAADAAAQAAASQQAMQQGILASSGAGAGAGTVAPVAEDTANYEQLVNAMNNPTNISANPSGLTAGGGTGITSTGTGATTGAETGAVTGQGVAPQLGANYTGSSLGTAYNGLGSTAATDTSAQLGGTYGGQTLGTGATTGVPGALTPPNPFMSGLQSVGEFAKANPLFTGIAAYTGLNAAGAFKNKGPTPTEQKPFYNPYHFSPDFQGSHPNPNSFQYTPKYPTYAAQGGIMRMDVGGLTPSGSQGTVEQMSRENAMGGNTMFPQSGIGGLTGANTYQNATNTPMGSNVIEPTDAITDPYTGQMKFASGGQTPSAQNMLNTMSQSTANAMQNERSGGFDPIGSASNLVSGNTSGSGSQGIDLANDPNYVFDPYKGQYVRRMANGGITDVHRFKSGGTDIYDASLRFADMMDNPNRWAPPDTTFQSVKTFQDTNPNTANKAAAEAAAARAASINKRSYVDTGYKYPTASRQPGQLNLSPVGTEQSAYDNQESVLAANGGIMQYSLGGYAQGDMPRLLRGPGDGVSDNIPATIGGKQPARLADGEFVIPARVVSELGNGSTDAGAKRLHQMMDNVQKARSKTVGKGNIAVDSKAYKAIPKK